MAAPEATDGDGWVPVLRPRLPPAERLLPYLQRIDLTRIYSNHGPLTRQLEQRLAELWRLPQGGVVCASSGTTALIGAIVAVAGRARPQRPLALLPGFTFVGTASAVEQCGYHPYLADVDAETWMIDPERLAHHPACDRIGLVVPVAPFGRPVPQLPWQLFQRATGIPVVIDGAASFEGVSAAPDRFLGTIPVSFSFHATKSFAAGEGGAVASIEPALGREVVRALNFGFYGSRDAQSTGLNGKMSEYHAAVGLAELDAWPEKSAALREVADRYRGLLRATGISERFYGPPDVAGCYALFRCAGPWEASSVEETLKQRRVDFRLWYGGGLHRQSYFADVPRDPLPTTDDLAPRLFGLPVAPDLPEAAIARVADCITGGIRLAAARDPRRN